MLRTKPVVVPRELDGACDLGLQRRAQPLQPPDVAQLDPVLVQALAARGR